MISLAVTLLIIALIAAVLGFGGIAGVAVEFAKIVYRADPVLGVRCVRSGWREKPVGLTQCAELEADWVVSGF